MTLSSRKYSVRPQARPTGESSLEGGFRVFMAPADMSQEGLEQGEFISIQSESTGLTVIAIVSRATDNIGGGHKGLGNPVIRISEYLRACHSFELKDRYIVQKWSGELVHISSITLTNVAANARPSDTNVDPEALADWTEVALRHLEGIYVNGTFEVTPFERGKRKRRQRFLVEQVEPSHADKDILIPYYFDHQSRVKFRGMDSSIESPIPRALKSHQFNFDGLKGNQNELEFLADAINWGVMAATVPAPSQILITGSAGTGKSSVLDRIQSVNWNKILTITPSTISSISSKTEANIAKLFDDAIACEPSLIVIDDIDVIAGKECSEIAIYLSNRMQMVKHRRVQIVATARRREHVHDRITPRFTTIVELWIPTVSARFQILQDLAGEVCEDDVLRRVADKTHAFSAPDLEALWLTAAHFARRQAREAVASSTPKSEETMVSWNGPHGAQPTETYDELTDEDFDAALVRVHPSAMNEIYVEVPKVRWSDIGGSEKIKKLLSEITRYGLQGELLNCPIRFKPNRGILLYGPPGCSKTLLAKAFAAESKFNFISVKGPELVSKYVGETEYNIREIFRKARAAAPCVIFFDEFDSMSQRNTGHESLTPVTALLTEMDGFEGLSSVIVLAATNRPQVVDKALLRPGRFGKVVYVGPPNEDARQEIIKLELKGQPVSSSMNLEDLAEQTEGWSGAEVAELCRIAALHAIEDWMEDQSKSAVISMKHFETAFTEVVPGLAEEMVAELQNWCVKGVDKIVIT